MTCTRCSAAEDQLTRYHCDGEDSGERWRCPMPGSCHLAMYCRRCDHQWVAPCDEHPGPGLRVLAEDDQGDGQGTARGAR